MKLAIHNHLGNPQIIDATRIVVLDKYDNPVSVSVEIEDGMIVTSHLLDADFYNMLRNLGIDKTVLVVHPHQKPLNEIVFSQGHLPG